MSQIGTDLAYPPMNPIIAFDPLFTFLIPSLAPIWIVVQTILWIVVNVSFAAAVLADSGELQRQLRRRTFFVSGGIWALATLVGGVFVAAIYWMIHHSTLRPQAVSDGSHRQDQFGAGQD